MTFHVPPDCPFCGSPVKCCSARLVYPQRDELYSQKVWACTRYPDCDSYVGCHKHSTEALGTLADSELRKWRQGTHNLFDPLWKSGNMSRNEAYKLLRKVLGTSYETTHIALFDIRQCQTVIDFIRSNQSLLNNPQGEPDYACPTTG